MINRKSTVLLLASLFILLNLNLYAQEVTSKIHPILQVVLLETPANETVDVYATLNKQYSLDDLRQETAHLSKKDKQKEVARVLREFAAEQQQAVLAFLQNAKQQNLVSHIDILWAGNTVVFSAVPQVIYDLAGDFDEIAEIRYDATIDESELIDPTGPSLPVPPGDGTDLAPQQGLILINAPAVWAEGDSGQGVLVSNNDSGCDWDHPDLFNNIWNNLGEDFDGDGHTIEGSGGAGVFDPGDINGIDDDGNGYIDDFIGWDFQGNDNNMGPSGTHGTSTAGIVCGDGTMGTQTGVAPRAKLMNCKISGEADSWLAIQYAVDNGVDITTSSHSYKWYFNPQPNYPMHRQMTDVELAAGVLHTNSTSNSGNSVGIPFNISAPGNCPGPWMHPDQTLVGGYSSVIGVGNVDAFTDIIESSSPWGPWTWEDWQLNHPGYPYPVPLAYQDYPYETIPGSMGLLKPDVSAPGASTTSLSDGGGYSSFGGTSSATPHTAGTAALILSINPLLTPEQVSMILQTTSVEKGAAGKDNRYGAGRIDAYEAYLLALASVSPTTFSLTVSVTDGWNMVSIPGLHPVDQDVTTWWSNLTGSVFEFDAGYNPVTTVVPTEGYWMNNAGAETYSYPAIDIVTHDPISVVAGWNMIGGFENIAPVSGLIPSSGTILSVFEFGTGYVIAADLVPGYGYWINVTDAGTVTIPDPPLSKGSAEVVEYLNDDWGKIIITDNAGRSYTLYAVKGEVNLDNYELPPAPPTGMFDIRFGSDRIAEDINSSIQSIEMSGIEHPIKVRVENMDIRLQDETGNEINENIKSGEEIAISNNLISKLMVSAELIPGKYLLYQNYPNPFNPSTTIKFALPQDSKVNLIIYSILGEEVGQLINQEMNAGYHQIEFNASTLASGVYLYIIKAGDFVETKKMVLMK
jgi:subtilisin family serine protease